ncbi:MAG: beta-N-acetylhexosaminidase [Chloroflexota bacterium]
MRPLMHSFVGTVAPRAILDAVRRGEISSFCLFTKSNIESPQQLRELTDSIRRAAQEGSQLSPLIGIDQEGGQLMAVTNGATELPGNMALGATRSVALAERAGHVLGRELLAMGVNLNFAPSLDVNVNPANPVIGIRAFGDDPNLVSELGVGFINGMQAAGVLATAKHFPGHGDTERDSHQTLSVVPHSLERMDAIELLPFRAAIKAGVAAIMTAHIIFAALDDQQPVTLSEKVLHQFLRLELGFKGLIITDAMDMHAVAQLGHEASVRRALDAKVDLVMLAHIPDQIELAARLDQSLRGQYTEAEAHILTACQRIPTELPSLDVIGCAEHQQIAQDIADQSITVVKNKGQLPLKPGTDARIVVITPETVDLTPADTSSYVKISLAEAIRQHSPHVKRIDLPYQADDEQLAAIIQEAQEADIVIIGTISVEHDRAQARLVQALYERGKSPIVLALRIPYDLIYFPMIETYLCTYSIRPASMIAAARVLFGEIVAQGVLPCELPKTLFV